MEELIPDSGLEDGQVRRGQPPLQPMGTEGPQGHTRQAEDSSPGDPPFVVATSCASRLDGCDLIMRIEACGLPQDGADHGDPPGRRVRRRVSPCGVRAFLQLSGCAGGALAR